MPKTLNQAYTLARLQEISLKTLQQEIHSTQKKPPLLSYPTIPSKFPQKLTAAPLQINQDPSKSFTRNPRTFNNSKVRSSVEFDEKRAKGLCFWCDRSMSQGINVNRSNYIWWKYRRIVKRTGERRMKKMRWKKLTLKYLFMPLMA